ncbi:flavin monoamine oxidase family protein [Oceanirhabdus sp. W0125-5]|uniref:flavin monoamine oxidase family protein n=1 Tax=Oceanirhabdus sp. W0125-5 TaxID=2999116 RepID=UPI0022F2EE20|nr:FAD-dependent oxidoreductase [Oceanirhabdus sp. W0125-5]WBW98080.1 FAD-dependent oxidoreductase [Oceanirhabdus sp. W0125-5]
MNNDLRYNYISNPTNTERWELLEKLLEIRGRKEDLPDIIDALSPPEDITSICPSGYAKGKNINIGIIGGGLSGLTAAFELRKLGVNIHLYEASDRIGGRISTHHFDKKSKYRAELGSMCVPISHECVWHYINLFKINTRPFIYKNLNGFTYIKNIRFQNPLHGKMAMKKIYPLFNLENWEKNIHWNEMLHNALVKPLLSLTSSERKEILQIKNQYSFKYNQLCEFSLREMLTKAYLSEGAIDLVSSLTPFIRSLQPFSYSEIMQNEYPLNYSQCFELTDGMNKLPASLWREGFSNSTSYGINHEDVGILGWSIYSPIKKIIWNKGDNKVTLAYKSSGRLRYEKCDFVVNTIPFSLLNNIEMSNLESNIATQGMRELNYIDSLKVFVFYKRRFWEDLGIFSGTSTTDLPNGVIYYPSDHYYKGIKNPEEPGVLLACFNLALDATKLASLGENTILEYMNRNLEKIHGLPQNSLDKYVLDYKISHWNSERWIGGAFSCFNPDQKRTFLHDLAKPQYDNKMFFAGEHVSPTHGWMQGAIKSALDASNKIAKVIVKNY